jgi:hypothetical protein
LHISLFFVDFVDCLPLEEWEQLINLLIIEN